MIKFIIFMIFLKLGLSYIGINVIGVGLMPDPSHYEQYEDDEKKYIEKIVRRRNTNNIIGIIFGFILYSIVVISCYSDFVLNKYYIYIVMVYFFLLIIGIIFDVVYLRSHKYTLIYEMCGIDFVKKYVEIEKKKEINKKSERAKNNDFNNN